VSRAVIISDIPADQIDAIARLHHLAGATVRVFDQGRSVHTVVAKYPDLPIVILDATIPSHEYAVVQAAAMPTLSTIGSFDPNHPAHGSVQTPTERTIPPGVSRGGAALIKSFEGCMRADGTGNFVPYRCPAGMLTIGWGHTNVNGRQFNELSVWSQQECDDVFVEDIRHCCLSVHKLATVSLNQNQFDALISFAYNCGTLALARSALLKRLNERDYTGAAAEFLRWNRGGGVVLQALTLRRAAEMELFMSAPSVSFAIGWNMSRNVSASE
jgi:lysozyme